VARPRSLSFAFGTALPAPKQPFARDLRRTFGVSPTYTEINAKLQADALRLGHGEVNFLSADEAAKASATNNAVLGRPWELWQQQALARH
jgi:hypothetical protein